MRADRIRRGFNRLSFLVAVVSGLAVAALSWLAFVAEKMKVADIYNSDAIARGGVSEMAAGYAAAEKDTWRGWQGTIYASPIVMISGFWLVRSLGCFLAFAFDRAHRSQDYRDFARQFALAVLWGGIYAAVAMLLTPDGREHATSLVTFASWAVPLLAAAFLIPFVLLRVIGWIVAGFSGGAEAR